MTEDETEAEVQLLELVRGNDAEEIKLTIEREAGAWNVTLSTPPHDARHKRRGRGHAGVGGSIVALGLCRVQLPRRSLRFDNVSAPRI